MALKPVNIKPTDISVSGNSVTLSSTNLAADFKSEEAKTIQLLSKQVAPVKAADITIDTQGRVVINNPAFLAAIEKKLNSPAPQVGMNATVCGAGCS